MQTTNIRFGDIASFKYGKMPNKSMVQECGRYPILATKKAAYFPHNQGQ